MNEDKNRPRSNQIEAKAGEEDVRRVLVDAGRRPELPAGDLDLIKSAAESEWRALVERERQRGYGSWVRGALAIAATLILALLVGLWWRTRTAPSVPDFIATVELVAGEPRLEAPSGAGIETEATLTVDRDLEAGTVVETLSHDERSVLALRLSGGESVRLASDSRIGLTSARLIELERGTVYIDTGRTARDLGGLKVLTPLGIVRDIGTQYEVQLSPMKEGNTVRVRVREGAVSLTVGSEAYRAAIGEQLTVGRDGSVARGAVALHGPEWAWVQAATPSLEIEGQALSIYLAWVSRETGWSVRFADQRLERSTADITLHGTIEGLTPAESLSVILPGSGLDYRVDNGTIWIEEAPGVTSRD